MKKSRSSGMWSRADGRTCPKRVDLRSGVLLALGVLSLSTAEAANLREIGYSALPGNGVQIILTADAPMGIPTTFSTQNPARIAVDLKGVHNGLRSSNQPVGISAVRSVDVVESGDRTRVVVNLIESVPHTLETQDNRLVLNINAQTGPRGADPMAAAPRAAAPAYTPAPAPAPAAATLPQDSALVGPAPRMAPPPRVTPVATFEPAPAPAPVAPPAPPPVVEAPPVTIPPAAPIIIAEAPATSLPTPMQTASEQAPPMASSAGSPILDIPTAGTPAAQAEPPPDPVASSEPVVAPPKGAAGRVMSVSEAPSATAMSHSAEPAPASFASSQNTDAFGGHGVADIDFRRGDAGEGRVIFTLTDPSIVVDLREEVGHVLMDFLKASSPNRLQRKFDVTDFDTPVKIFEVMEKDGNIHVDIASRSEFEYLAYQTDDLFTVEFRPLTKEQKEELKKKQIGYTGERLSLNFQDIEVRSVLQLLGDFTGLNMVVSDTVTGNITLRLQNVPWDQALEIILRTKGLAQRQTDNVVMIAPAVELAEQEKKELESMKDKQELAPLNSEFFQLQYAKASAIANLLKSKDNLLLTPERGQVSFDERTNILLVQDTSAKLEQIQRLLRRLDVAVRQVLIESRVVIATDSFTKDLGVRLGFSRANSMNGTDVMVGGGLAGGLKGTTEIDKGYFSRTYPDASGVSAPIQAGVDVSDADGLMVNLPAALASTGSGAIMNLLVSKVGSYLIQLELSAMEKEGKGEVVSSPRVVTSDKTKATISQGIEIPYQTVSDAGTKTEFKKAALTLEVTPSITPDDKVLMDLDVSKDSPNATLQTDAGVPVDTRNVKTTVAVDNGDTIVLGGVYEQEVTESTDKIPLFGDLPVVGRMFRREYNNESNRELLVFVTPKILKENLGMR